MSTTPTARKRGSTAPSIEPEVTPALGGTDSGITQKGLPVAEVSGYSSDIKFYATRYKQGGRTVYSLDLSLEQINSLITPPDPTKASPGNRAIRPAHADGFAKYLRERPDWVMPGMILRAPAVFEFDVQAEIGGVQFGIISFPRRAAADLHILDGQHRILGISRAMQSIADDLDKARSQLASARRVEPGGNAEKLAREKIAQLEKQRARLINERASMTIFVEEDPVAYKQMFFDIADNALGITASVRARFDTRKVVNRALDGTMTHPLLTGRVDPESDRIGRGSPYLMGAKHVAEIVRTLTVGLDGRVSKRQEAELKERDLADRAHKFFDILVEAFPAVRALVDGQITPDGLRKTSLLGSVLFLRVLAGTLYDLTTEHAFTDEMVEGFFAKLAPHVNGSVTSTSIWATQMNGEVFNVGAFSPRSRRQDLKAIKNFLVEWAIIKPDFVAAAPVAPPKPELEDGEVDFGAGYALHGADIPTSK